MAEEIRFPIVGEDRGATRVLKDVGRESAVTAAQTRILADSLDKQRRAADASAAATVASAKADKILRDASDEAIASIAAQRYETDKLAKSSKQAAGKDGVGALAGAGGAGGSFAGGGMGALIAAGIALSPVLVTVGTGLGGLGLAALAAGKNSKQLKAELVPLRSEFMEFGKQVQPTLLTDFGAAARLAGNVLTDIRPVTIATGKAMAQFLGLLGKDLQGQEWTSFFNFMASTAGPDVKLLGQNFIDLANTLPPLLKLLQPTATDLLSITDAVAKATKTGADYQESLQHTVQHENALAKITDMLRTVLFSPGAGLYQALKLTGIISSTTAGQQQHLGTAVQTATQRLAAEAKQLNITAAGYEHALGPLETYIGAQITEANDLATLNQDLKKSHDAIGLKTAAERASFSAAQTYIQDTLKQGNAALAAHKGIDAQITSIENALPKLESVKGKTAAYRQELQLLKGILDKLAAEKAIRENIVVTGTGTWHQAEFHSGVGHAVGPAGAAGAFIRQGTTATADDVIARVSKGELIVPSKMVAAGLVDHLRGAIPGFAAGGIVSGYHGDVPGLRAWTVHDQRATVSAITAGIAKGMAAAFMSSMGGGFGHAGPGGGAPAANAALARRMYPPWASGAEWAAWNYVAMRESGWSQYAYNPSGATGIPQALPYTKMPRAAWLPWQGGSANPMAQIGWMIGYMRSTYGDAIGAAAHERAFNWYGNGLRGGIFTRPTLIGVGERGPERVDVAPAGRGGGGQVVTVQVQWVGGAAGDEFMTWLRKQIRIRAGGDVQQALGRN